MLPLGLIILLIFGILSFLEYQVWKDTNLHRNRNPHLYDGIDLKMDNITSSDIERLKCGYSRAKNQKIVIAGLARDIIDKLKINIDRMVFIGSHFEDYRIVIFENDSTDGTRDFIKQKSMINPKIEVIKCCDLCSCECKLKLLPAIEGGALGKNRIDKLTTFRNIYLNYTRKNYSHFDLLLVMDLDNEGPCSIDGIMHSISFDDWDAIASNCLAPLPGTLGSVVLTYDSLAYVDYNPILFNNDSILCLIYNLFLMNWKVKRSKDDLIPVKSAFNGAMLYKMKSINDENIKYENVMNCEHIGLNFNMIKSGYDKIFINKAWKWYCGFQGPRDFKVLLK